MARWTITALDTGTSPQEKSVLTYLTDIGVAIDVPNVIFVIQNDSEKIVVDLSFESVAAIQRINNRTLRRSAEQEPEHRFAEIGLDPKSVSTVVLTHLHYDHFGTNRMFPNAAFYVQRSEVRYALAPNPPMEAIHHSPLVGLTPGWLGRPLRLLDGDYRLRDGITLIHLPGHTPGTQGLLVDTEDGVYCIAGDTVPTYENIEKTIPHGVHDSVSDWLRSLNRVRSLADYVIPSHDMRLFDTGPIVRWPGAYAHRVDRA